MADQYLACMLERCARTSGRVFVAEVDHTVVGFVAVLANVSSEEPDEDRAPYAYVSDLAVRSAYRPTASAARCSSRPSGSREARARASFASACWRGTRARGGYTPAWASRTTRFS